MHPRTEQLHLLLRACASRRIVSQVLGLASQQQVRSNLRHNHRTLFQINTTNTQAKMALPRLLTTSLRSPNIWYREFRLALLFSKAETRSNRQARPARRCWRRRLWLHTHAFIALVEADLADSSSSDSLPCGAAGWVRVSASHPLSLPPTWTCLPLNGQPMLPRSSTPLTHY